MRLRGYVPDIEATGRSHYLGAILWCSIICDMQLSPIQFYFIFAYLEVLMTRRIVSYVLMVLSFVVLNLVLRGKAISKFCDISVLFTISDRGCMYLLRAADIHCVFSHR